MMATRRSLWPREHGAYAQLLAPLATALALRTPTIAAALLALAARCAFLANEPLLVVLGHRGKRLHERNGRRAARRLAVLASLAASSGVVGLLLAPHGTSAVAGPVAIAAAIVIAFAWRRAEHSLIGELVAAVALPGASAPVAVACGLSPHDALILWITWAVGYTCSVVAVRRVIARHRHPASWVDAVVASVASGLALAACVAPRLAIAAVPLALASAVLVIRPPRATRLRAIGVALVMASVAAGSLALALG